MNRSSIINIWGFLLLTTLLYGCSGETPESLTPSSEDAMRIPMSFQIYSARNTTQSRANTDYYIDGTERKTLPAGSSLGVFAYYTNKKTWSEAKSSIEPNFMNDQEMKVMASVGQNGVSLSYNPTRYWPNDDNQKITFSGYYPFASMYLVLLPSPILISAPLCTNRFSILAADAELVPVICSTSRRVIISFVERYERTASSAVW